MIGNHKLCEHDWVGDDNCVYCKNLELEDRIAELEKQITDKEEAEMDEIKNSIEFGMTLNDT